MLEGSQRESLQRVVGSLGALLTEMDGSTPCTAGSSTEPSVVEAERVPRASDAELASIRNLIRVEMERGLDRCAALVILSIPTPHERPPPR